MAIYICTQKQQPSFQPHGQRGGQGCGETLLSYITTHTRGWKVVFSINHTPEVGEEGDKQLRDRYVYKTPSRLRQRHHLTRLIVHKSSSPLFNHTAKEVVRVVVRHFYLIWPHTPAGGKWFFQSTTTLRRSSEPSHQKAKETDHNTTAHWPLGEPPANFFHWRR